MTEKKIILIVSNNITMEHLKKSHLKNTEICAYIFLIKISKSKYLIREKYNNSILWSVLYFKQIFLNLYSRIK